MRRAIPVAALAAVAFTIGLIFGAGHHPSAARQLAERFAGEWSRGEYGAMYADTAPASRRGLSRTRFLAAYRDAASTATQIGLRIGKGGTGSAKDTFVFPATVRTRLFGTLHATLAVPVESGTEGPRVAWSRALLFPGLRAGESLSRQTLTPARGSLLARDGTTLASGTPTGAGQRSSPLGAAALGIAGEVGPLAASHGRELEAQGFPAGAIVGASGLELAFDTRLRGTPGGKLLAGQRVLATRAAKAGESVRTSISPRIQQAAAVAQGAQYGGVVALDPSTGEILAATGIALDALQPPGSTFKMVTVSGVLEAGIAHTTSTFPYATYTTLDGVKLENANGESCGGTLALAFATSCNSVFSPLGVKLGAARLVQTAEKLGFNHPTGLPGAVQSTIPPASQIQGELALGSTAIGQGQVQASALQMALIAATIADSGKRPSPTFGYSPGSHAAPAPAISASVAKTVRQLMIGVVRSGTGTSAAIPGVTVAGKTGTAELGKPKCEGGETKAETGGREEAESKSGAESCQGGVKDPQNTDAWFAAFAPAYAPKIAVGVLLVKDGAGGETAAPVAREVLEAGLR